MDHSLAKLDPFGHLSARSLVQYWLGSLMAIHSLWILLALFMRSGFDLAVYAAMLAGLAAASLSSHPALKAGLLGSWVGWWAFRFVRWPGLHLGIVLMLGMSLYVIARLLFAWRRAGIASVRVGLRHPLSSEGSWSELLGLTKHERRLVLGRARTHLGPMFLSWRRLLIGSAVGLAIAMLEIFFLPPDRDADKKTVELPRSQLGFFVILPLLAMLDPRDLETPLRRALRDHVLPEFQQQPWLWDRSRREAAKTDAT